MVTGAVTAEAVRIESVPTGTLHHRAVSPLELLFDLCFVGAVASAATNLQHAIVDHQVVSGLLGYLAVFFPVWWAWMNFTWVASATDIDDWPSRLLTFAQIVGVLGIAAGVSRAFDGDSRLLLTGFGIMRLALAAQVLRAAREDRRRRRARLRAATGIITAWFGWLALLSVPPASRLPLVVLMVLVELAVPIWANHRGPRHPWRPKHIAERYQLFMLIVLGESVLAATDAIARGLDSGASALELLGIATAGVIAVLGMWTLYFARPAHLFLHDRRAAFVWAYGHFLVYASAGAVGAALSLAVDHATGKTTPAPWLVIAIPVMVFAGSVWLVHLRPHRRVCQTANPADLQESHHDHHLGTLNNSDGEKVHRG